MLFLHALQVCVLVTGFVTVNSYVLFSANLDDFHKLAQKFVPDNLAMKLTELVSESSIDKRHDRDGRGQRKTTTDSDMPWNISNIHYYYERTERNEVQTNRVKTAKTTTESIFEPDRMHEKDYDRLEDVTFPQIMGKRYKTVKRMATTKEWFEEPPSFLRTIYPKNDDPKSPSHSIYYKDKSSNDRVKPNSPERDINDNYERNKEKGNSNIGREESSNGKQMMQYFPVENKVSQYKKQTKNETEKVRVNGRDISKIKQRKIRKLDNKGKDDSMIFDTIIMSKKKDSYEDYVAPKKDDDYLISDGISSNKKRPIPSKQRETNDEISLTSKSWQMLSVYRNTERGHRITSFTRKEPNKSILKESINEIASTIRERPNLSAERDVSDRISLTTRKRPTWSEQKIVYDETPEIRRPPVSIQRERTEKPTTTTQETFPDYIEREWMTTEKKTSPTENERMTTDRYTTEKEKITEDYVLEEKESDKLQPFNDGPVYEKDPIRARTESLLFNSKELEDQNNNTRYTMKGTGIPTREYYKMSTPDYYKKLPRIVEKYDFNEPIPEADREREKIDDRFAQEPARVNHKVRQQREKTGLSENQPRQKDNSPIQKRNQDKAGPIETILENIGFHFKAIADPTEYANT